MSYTHVWQSISGEMQWIPRSGTELEDTNESVTGTETTWYYVPDDPGLFDDHYEANGVVGNAQLASAVKNADPDDKLDEYVLVLDGDSPVHITATLTSKGGSHVQERFQLSLVELSRDSGVWEESEELASGALTPARMSGTNLLGKSSVTVEDYDLPQNGGDGSSLTRAYAVQVEEIGGGTFGGADAPQLNYELDIFVA